MRSELSEGFDTHGLGRFHDGNTSVTRFDESRVFFDNLTGSSIDLGGQFVKSTSDVSSVAIQDDDLSFEVSGTSSRFSFRVRGNVTSSDILDGQVLDVETDVITWLSFFQFLVVHFDGFDFSGAHRGSEGNNHTGFQSTGFDSADGHCTNTTDLVDILQRQSQRFVVRSGRFHNVAQSLEQSETSSLTRFSFTSPTLVPRHGGRFFNHVITVPSRNGDNWDFLGVITDLLDVSGDFLLDFLESFLAIWWFGVVHLVTGDNHLLDTQSEGQHSMFSGLTILGDTSFKFTSGRSDDKDGAIGLRSTGNHVLNEISVTRGINNGDRVFVGLEFPQSNIDSDTSFSFGLKLVRNPSIFERTFTGFGGFFLEFFDGSLIDTTAFVDQVTGGGRFTGIDVTDDDNVDMTFFFSHFCLVCWFRPC